MTKFWQKFIFVTNTLSGKKFTSTFFKPIMCLIFCQGTQTYWIKFIDRVWSSTPPHTQQGILHTLGFLRKRCAILYTKCRVYQPLHHFFGSYGWTKRRNTASKSNWHSCWLEKCQNTKKMPHTKEHVLHTHYFLSKDVCHHSYYV